MFSYQNYFQTVQLSNKHFFFKYTKCKLLFLICSHNTHFNISLKINSFQTEFRELFTQFKYERQTSFVANVRAH